MAYPTDKPSGSYELRDYDFAQADSKKIPMDEYLFKNGYKNAEESEVDSVPDAHEQNWLFDVLHRNLRYTLNTAEENKRLLEEKIATPTSIGQIKVGYGLEVTSNGTLSVVKGVAEDANIISYDLPVGAYMLWAGTQAPEYFIEPSGQTLLRDQYPELWEYAQSNKLVGTFFGEGDGKTTFTVKNIQDLINNKRFLIDKKNPTASSPTWYNLYSDGWLEQGGNRESLIGERELTVTLIKPYKDTNYSVFEITKKDRNTTYAGSGAVLVTNSKTKTSFKLLQDTFTDNGGEWKTCGYSSEISSLSTLKLKLILKALPTPPSNAVPTGTILNYTGKNIPDGYISPNGAELSRTTFNQLYQWAVANNLVRAQSSIPNTPHGYYGSGNGSTTFTIPNLRGVTITNNPNSNNFGKYIFKGTAQDIMLPNYNGQYTIGSGFVAPVSGWVDWLPQERDGGTHQLYVNNISISHASHYKYGNSKRMQFIVKKGDRITFDGTAIFVPSVTNANSVYNDISTVGVNYILKY